MKESMSDLQKIEVEKNYSTVLLNFAFSTSKFEFKFKASLNLNLNSVGLQFAAKDLGSSKAAVSRFEVHPQKGFFFVTAGNGGLGSFPFL